MEVRIERAFSTITHDMPQSAVGKTLDVAPELALTWVQNGDATAVDDAGRELVAAAAEADGPTPDASTPEAARAVVTTTPEEVAAFGKMKKTQLLAECGKRRIPASESETREELLRKLAG